MPSCGNSMILDTLWNFASWNTCQNKFKIFWWFYHLYCFAENRMRKSMPLQRNKQFCGMLTVIMHNVYLYMYMNYYMQNFKIIWIEDKFHWHTIFQGTFADTLATLREDPLDHGAFMKLMFGALKFPKMPAVPKEDQDWTKKESN